MANSESESQITRDLKNSAARETTNPGITTPSSSQEAIATAPPAIEEPKSFLGFNKEFAETISPQLRKACALDNGKLDGARFKSMLSVMICLHRRWQTIR